MNKVFPAIKTQSFIYDFDIDGGAVGSIGTGIIIPTTATFFICVFRVLTPVTSGGAALINVGWNGQLSAIAQNLGPLPLAAGSFAIPGTGAPCEGLEILFSISVAPLTAGKIIVHMPYIDSALRG